MYKDVIGILGGMGSYATLNLFKRLLTAFPAEKEWERPRMIIDNNCTMPSRVLAILDNEKYGVLINQMVQSVKHLIDFGATKIIFACNTSHYFLPEILKEIPTLKERFISLIDCCVEEIIRCNEKKLFLLATEGTISARIFHNAIKNRDISLSVPIGESYLLQRKIIEAVKQNNITEDKLHQFIELIKESEGSAVILGCTEFSVIYDNYKKIFKDLDIKIYDPIECVINKLTKECN